MPSEVEACTFPFGWDKLGASIDFGSGWTLMSKRTLIIGTVAGGAIIALLIAERRRPSRPVTQPEPRRTLHNLAMGAGCMAVIATIEKPLVDRLTAAVERRRIGLAQLLPAPARDIVAFLLLDWTMYGWHVATHRVAFLWRFHLVHHVDQDMDASTALRFHAADMLVSLPFRLAQVALTGAGPRAHQAWQSFFFLSVLFHHSRLRLSPRAEQLVGLALTTPGMHDIHHRADPATLNSNWSSGLSFWDRLHGSFRTTAPDAPIGVPGYDQPLRLSQLLVLPLRSPHHADDRPLPAQP
jgi:sterol desaturase/sphingolipid hydroxylase (fatty acid hydroxylase superfamily)